MKNGKEILKELEQHCNEELNCSTRLRFQITETMQRMIKEHEALKCNISSLVTGDSNATYSNHTHGTRKHPTTK